MSNGQYLSANGQYFGRNGQYLRDNGQYFLYMEVGDPISLVNFRDIYKA